MRALTLAALATVLLTTSTHAQQQASALPTWQAGQGATGDNTYLGAIDMPATGSTVSLAGLLSVGGWFVDTTAQGWAGADDVQVFLGPMDTGQLLGHATIGLNRPDVAATLGNPFWASAGWLAAVDPGALPPGQNTLFVNAHTPSKGWWSLPVAVMVRQTVSSSGELLAAAPALQGAPPSLTIRTPNENEIVSTRTRSLPITGTATDPTNGPKSIDWVEVWLNGEANSDAGLFLGVATLSGDGSWSLPFDPGAHPPLNSNLYVYAHSALNGKKTLMVRHFFLADRPL